MDAGVCSHLSCLSLADGMLVGSAMFDGGFRAMACSGRWPIACDDGLVGDGMRSMVDGSVGRSDGRSDGRAMVERWSKRWSKRWSSDGRAMASVRSRMAVPRHGFDGSMVDGTMERWRASVARWSDGRWSDGRWSAGRWSDGRWSDGAMACIDGSMGRWPMERWSTSMER